MEQNGRNRVFRSEDRSTVTDVLAYFGKDSHLTRGRFVRSPFRDERTPSFHITPNGRGWKDFGDGSGGGVIDLVMRLAGCDRLRAIRILSEMEGTDWSPAPAAPCRNFQREHEGSRSFTIFSAGPFTSGVLLEYSRSRGISKAVLEKYCTEVTAEFAGGKGKRARFIGFRNNDGGFVLRSALPGSTGKRCTSSAPTFLDSGGNVSTLRSCSRVAVFEGMFDFLSFKEILSSCTLKAGTCDSCILNSVVNIPKALDYIMQHRSADLFLDNDRAGREAAAKIMADSDSCGCRVTDMSHAYKDYNDLNDFLCGENVQACTKIINLIKSNQDGTDTREHRGQEPCLPEIH